MSETTLTLYELTEAYQRLVSLAASEDEDGDGWQESLSTIQDDFSTKACNIAKAIRNLQATEAAYKAEAERMTAAAKTAGRRVNWLKGYLVENMIAANIGRVDTVPRVTLHENANPTVTVDIPPQFLPNGFSHVETKVVADKDAILKAVKNGTWKPLDGVTITTGYHIRIK